MCSVNNYTTNIYDGLLGSGGYGVVRLCNHNLLGQVAVKCFRDAKIPSSKNAKRTQNEAKHLKMLKHECVINFHELIWWETEKEKHWGIVMEYMKYGNLQEFMESSPSNSNFRPDFDKPDINWGLRLRILQEICSGLNYLHTYKKGCTHGDIKPQNILLGEGLHAKIADFGAAQLELTLSGSATQPVKSAIEAAAYTYAYVAPEVLNNVHSGKQPPSDIFSFGNLAYEVATRRYPVQGIKDEMLIEGVKQGQTLSGEFTKYVDKTVAEEPSKQVLLQGLNELLQQCWSLIPEERPKAIEAHEQLVNLRGTMKENDIDISAHANHLIEKYLQQDPSTHDQQVPLKIYRHPYDKAPENAMELLVDHLAPPKPVPSSSGLTQKLSETEIAAINDSIYMVGGHEPDLIRSLTKFQPSLKRLTRFSMHLNQRRCECIALRIGTKFYVIGGVVGAFALRSVECIDMGVSNPTWVMLAPMVECRYQAAAAVLNGKIFIFGGKNHKDEVLDSIESYDVENNEWTMLEQKLLQRRYGHVVFPLISEFIICCGGKEPKGSLLATSELFNLRNPVMKDYDKPLPEARSEMALVTLNEHVLLLGGFVKSGENVETAKSVVSFNLKEQAWKHEDPMLFCRTSCGAGVVGGVVYVVGGLGPDVRCASSVEKMDLNKEKQEWVSHQTLDRYVSGHAVVS